MGIGTALAVAIPAAAGIGTAALGAHAAGNAANTQANAAVTAAQIQAAQDDKALALQKEQFNTQQKNIAPWLTAGTGAINTLSGMLPDLTKPFGESFTAPTNVTEQNDPGFQFRLQEGQKALEASKAASGDLLSGGTGKALNRYAQDYASNEYSNVYNRAFNDFTTKYNIFKQNQSDTYNRYAGMAGIGQSAAQQIGQAGQKYADTGATILVNSGNAQAAGINNAAAARASGYIGAANAWTGGINSASNSLSTLALLKSMQPAGSTPSPGSETVPWDQYYGYGG